MSKRFLTALEALQSWRGGGHTVYSYSLSSSGDTKVHKIQNKNTKSVTIIAHNGGSPPSYRDTYFTFRTDGTHNGTSSHTFAAGELIGNRFERWPLPVGLLDSGQEADEIRIHMEAISASTTIAIIEH